MTLVLVGKFMDQICFSECVGPDPVLPGIHLCSAAYNSARNSADKFPFVSDDQGSRQTEGVPKDIAQPYVAVQPSDQTLKS